MPGTPPPLRTTIDYTSRDFESLRADMVRLIRARLPQWEPSPADFGLALVEAMAYAMDSVHYYLDRVANEAYLDTAVQRESLYSIAEMFNYRPKEASPAVVWLQFSNSTQSPVSIPAGTRCQATVLGASGSASVKNFETVSSGNVPAIVGGEPGVTSLQALEGRTYTDEILGVSTGFVRQRFILPRTSVLQDTISITTQIADSLDEWRQVGTLSGSSPTDRVYTVTRLTDGSSRVEFGNGFAGLIPPLHSTIRATYRVGGGSAGNVAIGTVKVIVDPVLYGVSVTNPAVAVGGTDTESIDSIRVNAARAFRSRGRAVTLGDFEGLAETITGVAKAKAVGNNASSVTIYIVPDYSGIREDDHPAPPDDVMLTRARELLETYSMAGVTISVFGPAWQHVYIRLSVYCTDTAVQADVEKEIRRRMWDLYGFDWVDFDGYVSAADIATALRDIDGVRYIEVDALSTDSQILDPSTDPATFSNKTITMGSIASSAIQDYTDDDLLVVLEGGI